MDKTQYMAFTTNKNLFFIDSMQFMNYSLDALVKNLSHDDCKYLSQKFTGEQCKLVKKKNGVCRCEYMESFKKFFDKEMPDRGEFYSSLEDEWISEKRLFTCY